MKVVNSTKFAIVAAGALSLAGFAMANGHGGGQGGGPMNNPGLNHMSAQGLQNSQFGRTTAEAARNKHRVSPKPTPRGHHYGWQRGTHNPHQSPTP